MSRCGSRTVVYNVPYPAGAFFTYPSNTLAEHDVQFAGEPSGGVWPARIAPRCTATGTLLVDPDCVDCSGYASSFVPENTACFRCVYNASCLRRWVVKLESEIASTICSIYRRKIIYLPGADPWNRATVTQGLAEAGGSFEGVRIGH